MPNRSLTLRVPDAEDKDLGIGFSGAGAIAGIRVPTPCDVARPSCR